MSTQPDYAPPSRKVADKMVRVPVSQEEYDALEAEAKRAGHPSLTAYARHLLGLAERPRGRRPSAAIV